MTYKPLSIELYTNNKGLTFKKECSRGKLSLAGASLPAEEVPDNPILFNNIPFFLLKENDTDNIELINETNIPIDSIIIKRIHFVGTCSTGDFYTKISFYDDNELVHKDKLYFTDFLDADPHYNDQPFLHFSYMHSKNGKYPHVHPTLWYNSIEFNHPIQISNIKFYENHSMHIFAITLEY